MSFREWAIVVCAFFLLIGTGATTVGVEAAGVQDPAQAKADQTKPPEPEWITVEELKSKLAKNEAVTIVACEPETPSFRAPTRSKSPST